MKRLFLVMILLTSAACKRDPEPKGPVEVEYRVSSSSGALVADVTYMNETGGLTQIEEAPLPFSVKIKYTQRPSSLAVVAMLPDQNGQSQSVTGTILVAGQVVKTQTAVGAPPLVDVVYVLQ